MAKRERLQIAIFTLLPESCPDCMWWLMPGLKYWWKCLHPSSWSNKRIYPFREVFSGRSEISTFMKTVFFLYFEQQYVILELTHRPCILVTLLEDCWMHKGRDHLFSMKTISALPKEMRGWKWSRMCLKEMKAELRRIYLPEFSSSLRRQPWSSELLEILSVGFYIDFMLSYSCALVPKNQHQPPSEIKKNTARMH